MVLEVLEILEVAAHYGVCELKGDGVTCSVVQVHTYQGHIVGVARHGVGKVA